MIALTGALIGLIYGLTQRDKDECGWVGVLGWTVLAALAALVLADTFGLHLDPDAVPGDHFG